MSTVLKFGPSDHSRTMTFDEFLSSDYQSGYKYELIHGRLFVSPEPNQPHSWVLEYFYQQLWNYAQQHFDVVNRVTFGARVFVPNADETTCPEPDVAVYRDFPLERGPFVQWEDVSPLLVVEVMSGDLEKDLQRNVDLYLQVPSIEEYWVIDIRDDAARPVMIVHRREENKWNVHRFHFGETYQTSLLPKFELKIDPVVKPRE